MYMAILCIRKSSGKRGDCNMCSKMVCGETKSQKKSSGVVGFTSIYMTSSLFNST